MLGKRPMTLAVALAVALPTASARAQTLANPAFEGAYVAPTGCANVTGAVASGWIDNTCFDPSRPRVRYVRDTVIKHGGAAAQQIALTAGRRAQFGQFLATPFEVGRRYEVGLWLRSREPMFVELGLRQADAPYTFYSSRMVKLTPTWTRYTFGGSTETTAVALLILATRPGTFWVDDASLIGLAQPLPRPRPPATAIPRGFFGMHLNDLDTPWPAVGGAIGTVRVWDAGPNRDGSGRGAQWAEVNPAPGIYDWSGVDARVAAAEARGAAVIYTLGGRTPRWASARPDETDGSPGGGSPYGPGQAAEPRSDALWRSWVRTVATRYRGRIKFWEIWNEPDLPLFYTGNPDRLVELARSARAVLKQVDPGNQVLTPGFSNVGGPGLLDYFLAAGGGATADIVASHFYVDRPEDNGGWRMANLQGVLARYGAAAKPLWNTEQGWIDLDGSAPPIAEEVGAAYVARSYILAWAHGLGHFAYYTWDNRANQFPFIEPDRATLRSPGRAYREVAAWLMGRVMTSLAVDARGTYRATLRGGDGRLARILWNPNDRPLFTVPGAWGATEVRDLEGGRQPIGASLEITGSPLLVQ